MPDPTPTPSPAAAATPASDASAGTPPAAPVTPEKPAAAPAKQSPEEAKAAFEKKWAEWKAPDGWDKDKMKPLVDWAQKAGLPPEMAAQVALRDRERAQAAEAQFKHMAEKGWLEELQKDPVLGGEKSRETMVTVMRAHDKLDPKIQALIKDHGVLYNPIVVRVLHDIGSKMKEDSFVRPGSPPAEQKKSLNERFVGLFEPKK